MPNINSKQGFVYFIGDTSANKVKIGYSKNPYGRLKQISTTYPGKLTLLKCIPGSVKDERLYHKLFCHSRICREWFTLTADISHFINR